MKKWMRITLLCLCASTTVRAQAPNANPVVSSAREIYDRQAKYIAAAAEQMPEDKYNFHATQEQWTFGKIISHVAQSNFGVCAILSDTPVPQGWKATETDPKNKLVAAVNASFDFCSHTLANLKDARLGDTVIFFGGRQVPRARALIELTDDLEDHYTQLAIYLRLNGMLPPSAQPAPK